MRKLRLIRRFQKTSLYKKGLIIFSLIMLVLGGVFLGYVYNSMIVYERNLVDNYISYLASSGKLTKEIDNNLFSISKFENSNAKIIDGVNKLYKSANLTIKKNSKLTKDDIYAYNLYNKDKLVSTVSLKSINSYTRMGILKIDEWEIIDNKTHFENGIYNYEITVPSNYQVIINNQELTSDDVAKEGDVEGLERLTEYIEIAKSKKYEIKNLVYEPVIKIFDENHKEVKYEIKDNVINVTKKYQEYPDFNSLKSHLKTDFDVLKLAENWSLFLTDDLQGSYHGFNVLTPYLINGSYMYDMAYGWAHNVDITFVSRHRLKNPVFTNETVKNCVSYNDLAFSCEVYLEKNMVVGSEDKVDVMHDRLYFIYYENGYKLVNMEAIKD